MNQTIDGNNRKPVPRNPNPAAGGSVKQGAPVKRAVNDPSARQPQRITQRPVKQGQRSVQQAQRTVQQAQRPVQQRKPVPVKRAKPVKQKEPKEPVETMKILKPLVIGVSHGRARGRKSLSVFQRTERTPEAGGHDRSGDRKA